MIRVRAWSLLPAERLSETSQKDPPKRCSTNLRFWADADDLIATVSEIMLNLLMAFNRMLKKDFRRVLHKRP